MSLLDVGRSGSTGGTSTTLGSEAASNSSSVSVFMIIPVLFCSTAVFVAAVFVK